MSQTLHPHGLFSTHSEQGIESDLDRAAQCTQFDPYNVADLIPTYHFLSSTCLNNTSLLITMIDCLVLITTTL